MAKKKCMYLNKECNCGITQEACTGTACGNYAPFETCDRFLSVKEWDNLYCNKPDCHMAGSLCCQIHRIHRGIDPYYYSNYNTYYNKKKGAL